MLEELERLAGITSLLRLLHLPAAVRPKDAQVAVLEKAYLMQLRLDLEARVDSANRESQ